MWISQYRWDRLNQRVDDLEKAITMHGVNPYDGIMASAGDRRIGMAVSAIMQQLGLKIVDTATTEVKKV